MILSLPAHAHMLNMLMVVLMSMHSTIMFFQVLLNMLVLMDMTACCVMTVMLFHVMFYMLVMMLMSVFHHNSLAEFGFGMAFTGNTISTTVCFANMTASSVLVYFTAALHAFLLKRLHVLLRLNPFDLA